MLPDNRIRLSSTKIDFAADVGITGQDHDDFPAAGQARYDHARMMFVGLLANQSSHSEPTNFRQGTLWYNLETLEFLVRKDDDTASEWATLAETIGLTDGSTTEEVITLKEWYDVAAPVITGLAPSVTFSGSCTANNIVSIPIPTAIQSAVATTLQPFVWINGLLQDPRNTSLLGNTSIDLTGGVQLSAGDTFTVELKNVGTFHAPNVVIP